MKPKVLLVDDNLTVIRIISKLLEDEGFDIFFTSDSTKAIEMAHAVLPDIMLLDIIMPQPDGFELCRLLKDDADLNEVPVIILSAETDSRDLKKALELGAMDYIRKPADQTELIARVRSACRIRTYQDKLREMASKDGLTGLWNHNELMHRLGKAYGEQTVIGGNITFVMMDIDFFKKINDTYGHMAGDSILKEISCILSWSLDKSLTIGRYGGEEFGVIIPGAGSDEVLEIFEGIRKSIEKYDFPAGDGKTVSLTVSTGFCNERALKGSDYSEVVKKADDALYSAKRGGRNRVLPSSRSCDSYFLENIP